MENGKGKMVSVFLYFEKVSGKWERENGERIFIFGKSKWKMGNGKWEMESGDRVFVFFIWRR
jgi:hypothetical protein